MKHEEDLFRAFKEHPAQETLIALLQVHQNRIYNVCFQILGHAQDAEDAAQDAILKAMDGIRDVGDASALRRWLYRVAFNTALNAGRERMRRRRRERKGRLMMESQASPEPGEVGDALYRAITQLDDGLRELLVRHYFEKATLKELAEEQRCSEVAVWKRIEKGRARLRELLSAGGASGLILAMDRHLEAIVSVSAPTNLLGPAVIAKAAEVVGLTSTSASMVLGGAAVSGKSTSLAIPFIIAGLFFAIGLIGGIAIKNRSNTARSGSEEVRGRLVEVFESLSVEAASAGKSGGASEPPSADPDPNKSRRGLTEKLGGIRDSLKKHDEEWRTKVLGVDYPSASFRALMKSKIEAFCQLVNPAIAELRSMIFEDPRTYVEFLREAETEPYLWFFARAILVGAPYEPGEEGEGAVTHSRKLAYQDFPPQLMESLDELLLSGSAPLKIAVLDFQWMIKGAPSKYQDFYRSLLSPNETAEVQAAALRALDDKHLREVFPTVRNLVESCTDVDGLAKLYRAIERMEFAEAEEFLLGRLAASKHCLTTYRLAWGLSQRVQGASPAMQDRYAEALVAALRGPNDGMSFRQLVETAIRLPLSKAQPVLEEAVSHAPEPGLAETVRSILERIREGTTDRYRLQEILRKSYKLRP